MPMFATKNVYLVWFSKSLYFIEKEADNIFLFRNGYNALFTKSFDPFHSE